METSAEPEADSLAENVTFDELGAAFEADFRDLLRGGLENRVEKSQYRRLVASLPEEDRDILETELLTACSELAAQSPSLFIEDTCQTEAARAAFARGFWTDGANRARIERHLHVGAKANTRRLAAVAREENLRLVSWEALEAHQAAMVAKRLAGSEVGNAILADAIDTIDPDAGRPLSTRCRLSELEPIVAGEMVPGKVHRGRVLWCKTVSDAYKDIGVVVLAIDRRAADLEAAFTLKIFNCLPASMPTRVAQAWIPKGAIISIREPYCKAAGTVRSDYPAAVEFHSAWPDDEAAPSALALKTLGNEHFVAKEYRLAVRYYTQALAAEARAVDTALRQVLLSNRAAAWLGLGDFAAAEHDAIDSLEIEPSHPKSLLRLARAIDGLGRHTDALKVLTSIRGAKKAEIGRIRLRIRHQAGDAMALSASATADIADYFSDAIEIRETVGKGRGLFLTRSVMPDEPLFVERAFVAAVLSPSSMATGTTASKTAAAAIAQEDVVGMAIRRACSAVEHDARLALICGGPDETQLTSVASISAARGISAPADAQMRCSVIDVRSIIKRNSFATEGGGCGLFVVASFMNHAGEARTTERVIEDAVMFVRARRALEKGEELTTAYFSEGSEGSEGHQWAGEGWL